MCFQILALQICCCDTICHYPCAGPGDVDESCGAVVSVDVLIGSSYQCFHHYHTSDVSEKKVT